jgi:aminocarboxymuconate-semialdehyde decarboxylase
MLKIDVFPHILPRRFYDRLMNVAPRSGLMVKRVSNIPVMIDLDRRFEIMDRHEGYRQVLTLAAPPLEAIATRPDAPILPGWPTTKWRRSLKTRTASTASSRSCQ